MYMQAEPCVMHIIHDTSLPSNVALKWTQPLLTQDSCGCLRWDFDKIDKNLITCRCHYVSYTCACILTLSRYMYVGMADTIFYMCKQ